jgi:hypothetical protein
MKKYILLFLACFLAFGCSKKEAELGASANYQREARSAWLAYDDSFRPEGPSGVEGQTPPAFREMSNLFGSMSGEPEISATENAERKIEKRASIRIRVENPAAADVFINDLMAQYGAYATSTAVYEDSRNYTIRVPSGAYNDFLAGMDGMGKLISRSQTAEDVTVRYYDLEGRLATRKELLKTFQSYLGKAKSMEEILSVERRIAELQGEIDITGKNLRALANDVDYSIITLNVLGPVSSAAHRYPTLPDKVKGLFNSFGNFLSTLAVIIIGIVIFGIPVVLLLIFFFWILFGKIGLLRKLMFMAMDKKDRAR